VGAWGPAIGRGDWGKGVALPHYTPKFPENIFFGKHNVKFGHFSDKCRVKLGHFVNFSYIISGKNVLPPPNFTELLPYAHGPVLGLPASLGGKL